MLKLFCLSCCVWPDFLASLVCKSAKVVCALFPGEIKLCGGVVSIYSLRAFLLHKLLGHVDRLCLRQELKLRQLYCMELGWNPGPPWCQREFGHCFPWAKNSEHDFLHTLLAPMMPLHLFLERLSIYHTPTCRVSARRTEDTCRWKMLLRFTRFHICSEKWKI